MDAETRQEFRQLREQLDSYHIEITKKLHGERGDNGLFGRLQAVEYSVAVVRWGARALWLALLAVISGVWAAFSK